MNLSEYIIALQALEAAEGGEIQVMQFADYPPPFPEVAYLRNAKRPSHGMVWWEAHDGDEIKGQKVIRV